MVEMKLINKVYNKVEKQLPKIFSDLNLIKINSIGRKSYEKLFIHQKVAQQNIIRNDLKCEMWGIKFRNKLCNSAGMFKNGEGYDVCANLGAGAYIGGTSTYNPRKGNSKENINLPFVRLTKSKITVNYLGLPNLGDEVLARKIYTERKVEGCPIGWSVMRSPDFSREEGEEKLVKSLFLYQANPQIDFLEINVSCPNVKKSSSGIIDSLNFISESFLKKRSRHLPVVVKLSNDITKDSLESVLKSLVTLGFDGVNIGNTSTDYSLFENEINQEEKKPFKTFTSTFSGGIGGKVLKQRSLDLCRTATNYLKTISIPQEFHVIRTGGIENHQDLLDSQAVGVSYNQWQTGFFFSYMENGVNVYKNVLNV